MQAATISYPQAFTAPILSCTRAAVDTTGKSGVLVATSIKSISSGDLPDLFNKSIATCLHISDVASPSPTKCLFSIPVRDNIQSFEVSTIFSKSVFVSVLSGRYFAVTVILAFNLAAPNDH